MVEGSEQGGGVGFAEYLVEQVLDAGELERLEGAIARRRRELGIAGEGEGGRTSSSVSRVKEARPHQDGYLQAETRVYRRKKDGRESERGPYWYFRYHEGGKQKKLYLGRTDDPEGALAEKRAILERERELYGDLES